MKNIVLFTLISIIFAQHPGFGQTQHSIQPGAIWKDMDQHPINAHGGGILFYNKTYYWFGEIKKGKTWRVPYVSSWEDYRVVAGGVACYSSKDLLNWSYEGIALKPDAEDSTSDLHLSRVVERPKVIYNPKTRQFVMWMHIDKEDYSYARSGVAVSNTPQGPYRFIESSRPNGQMSRDMTVFQDEDGKAYLFYSSEDNLTMQVCLLSEDYLKPTTNFKRILIGANREAPAVFKSGGKYFLITSLCSGWDPNTALYAESDQPLGDWTIKGNPCTGPDADSTYHSQSTYVLPVNGKPNEFIFMADRWNKTDLEDSRYVWLPMVLEAGKPKVIWKDSWIPGK